MEVLKNNRAGARFSYVDGLETDRDLGKRFTYSLSVNGDQIFKNLSYYIEFGGTGFFPQGIRKRIWHFHESYL